MPRPHPKLTEKQRILEDLDRARKALAGNLHTVSTSLAPKALLSRSMANHRIWWVVGAAVVGLITVRMVLPKRANTAPPRPQHLLQGSGWMTLLATPLIGLLRKNLTDLVTNEIRNRFVGSPHPVTPQPLVSHPHV